MNITNKHHILRYPLIVYSGGPQNQIGVLPGGSSLRYVESFAEGFDRFLVFVNVERSPLALEEITPPDLVDPLSAPFVGQTPIGYPSVTIEELSKLLRSLGVKKSDLHQVFESYE